MYDFTNLVRALCFIGAVSGLRLLGHDLSALDASVSWFGEGLVLLDVAIVSLCIAAFVITFAGRRP